MMTACERSSSFRRISFAPWPRSAGGRRSRAQKPSAGLSPGMRGKPRASGRERHSGSGAAGARTGWPTSAGSARNGDEAVRAVFDTNILVDYLNGITRAQKEIARHRQGAISIISWMEVMVGARDEDD